MDVAGKRLLILGGGAASYDMVKQAQAMGLYTIVTDNNPVPGIAKQIADEIATVSTADIDALVAMVKEKNIDGVLSGPSEFNLRNVIRICERAQLPCYTDMQTWDNCANKNVMTAFCREYGVDCPAEYDVSENSSEEELEKVEFPVIVKPVDSSSSNGVAVCRDIASLREACANARSCSTSGKIVVQQYIENGGEIFSIRYLVRGEDLVPYLTMDDYIVDPTGGNGMFTCFFYGPSKYSQYYLEKMDQKVRNMLRGMGVRNGSIFMQALPYKGKLYLIDMGYRLSGGMVYKFTVPLMGVNDMQMLIRTALGEPMFTDDEIKEIEFLNNPRRAGQISVSLNPGRIGRIEGLEECRQEPGVLDVLQFYYAGDEVPERVLGTLGQLFARFTIIADSIQELAEKADSIQKRLQIFDEDGNKMNTHPMDFARIYRRN